MANSKQDSHNKQPKYQGEAILLESRVEEIERQQQEEKKSDKAHKDRQLTFNKWLVIYTGGLLLAAVIANAVSIYQGIQMRQATRAAERAAKAAEDSIGIAQQTAKDTVTALNIAQEQVDAAKRSARTAEITAATGVKQLELFGASQRPSMGVYAVDFIPQKIASGRLGPGAVVKL